MAKLTSKELTALEDQLGVESLLVKKYGSMAEQASDPQIKAKFTKIAKRHQDHFNKLFGYLK